MIATLKESEIDELVTHWACIRKSTLLRAVATWVSVVRADVAMKPINVMGYEEPTFLLASEVVDPFETLVMKARTKIIFMARCLNYSNLAMDSKDGTLPPGLVVYWVPIQFLNEEVPRCPLYYTTPQDHPST